MIECKTIFTFKAVKHSSYQLLFCNSLASNQAGNETAPSLWLNAATAVRNDGLLTEYAVFGEVAQIFCNNLNLKKHNKKCANKKLTFLRLMMSGFKEVTVLSKSEHHQLIFCYLFQMSDNSLNLGSVCKGQTEDSQTYFTEGVYDRQRSLFKSQIQSEAHTQAVL